MEFEFKSRTKDFPQQSFTLNISDVVMQLLYVKLICIYIHTL